MTLHRSFARHQQDVRVLRYVSGYGVKTGKYNHKIRHSKQHTRKQRDLITCIRDINISFKGHFILKK